LNSALLYMLIKHECYLFYHDAFQRELFQSNVDELIERLRAYEIALY